MLMYQLRLCFHFQYNFVYSREAAVKLPSFQKIKDLAAEFNPTYYAALKSAHSWLPLKSLVLMT